MTNSSRGMTSPSRRPRISSGGVRGAGIYQRAAGFVKRDQLVSGVVFVRLATPSPGAEPEMGDEQSAASYPALFHGTNLAASQRGIWLRL
jgi:hypothetical protein